MLSLVISSILTATINLALFLLIPAIWWFIGYRKKESFCRWIGLYKPRLTCGLTALIVWLIVYCLYYYFYFTQYLNIGARSFMENSSVLSNNVFAGMGINALLPAFIQNFIGNGVAEEILFRGFLCKRLCNTFHVRQGIFLQALLFGAMHNVVYILGGLKVDLWSHVFLFSFAGIGALLFGWLNEKGYHGSIIPSIVFHGFVNFITSLFFAFM